jgi:small subunit ribosomal protein S20
MRVDPRTQNRIMSKRFFPAGRRVPAPVQEQPAMPNIKSAFRSMRKSSEARLQNRAAKSRAASARKRLHEAIAAGDKGLGADRLKAYYSVLDKAVKRGILKANTAARYKSRAARRASATAAG